MLAGSFDRLAPVFLADPLNRQHRLYDGLVSRWLVVPEVAGGAKWYDLCGSNHGTLNSFGTGYGWSATTRPGGFGALKFNGTTSYIDCGSSSSLITTGAITIAAWVYTTSATDVQRIVSTLTNTPYNGYELLIHTTSSKGAYFQAGNAGALTTAYSNNGDFPQNQWIHVAVTYDAINTATMYYNGSLGNGSHIGPTAIGASTAHFNIGRWSGGTANYWQGNIDDVCVWNRALSAAEIYALYLDTLSGYQGTLNRFDIDWLVPVYQLKAGTGIYSLSGVSIAPSMGAGASCGTYTLTGEPVTPGTGLTVALGSYSLTGDPVTPTLGQGLATGTIALSGDPVTPGTGQPIGTGSYVLTGDAITWTVGENVVVDTGSYTLTGAVQSPALTASVASGTGSYSLTGQAVSWTVGKTVTVDTGVYTLAGATTGPGSLAATLAAGSYTIAGAPIVATAGQTVALAAGSYTLAGASVTPRLGGMIALGTGVYVLHGAAITPELGYSNPPALATGIYGLTGHSIATLTKNLFPLGPIPDPFRAEDAMTNRPDPYRAVDVSQGPDPYRAQDTSIRPDPYMD